MAATVHTGCYWGMQLMRAGRSVHVGQGVQGNTRGQILILSPLVTLSEPDTPLGQQPWQQQQLRTCDNLVLKLSKSGSGVWAPNSLSMDQNMEGWTNFYLSKTSKKGPYLTRGRK